MSIFAFPYREERARDGTMVYRPFAPLDLQAAEGTWERFHLYADAGADLTLLTEADCDRLGYVLEAGEERQMKGVCSGPIRTFVHRLRAKLGADGAEPFDCNVAFAEAAKVPLLLGRRDVFIRYRVCYDEVQRVTQFEEREENSVGKRTG